MTPMPLRTLLTIVSALCLILTGTAGAMARTTMAIADAGGAQLVICGADGVEVIDLPGAPAPANDCDICPACHTAAAGPLPGAQTVPQPSRVLRAEVSAPAAAPCIVPQPDRR